VACEIAYAEVFGNERDQPELVKIQSSFSRRQLDCILLQCEGSILQRNLHKVNMTNDIVKK
jgi:hypothetical protein